MIIRDLFVVVEEGGKTEKKNTAGEFGFKLSRNRNDWNNVLILQDNTTVFLMDLESNSSNQFKHCYV